MPEIRLDHADATELAEMLTFIAEWLNRQTPAHADSLAAFVGNTGYDIDTLREDLHRFVFLLGISDGEELFGESTP